MAASLIDAKIEDVAGGIAVHLASEDRSYAGHCSFEREFTPQFQKNLS
jgi:hypothetical protein